MAQANIKCEGCKAREAKIAELTERLNEEMRLKKIDSRNRREYVTVLAAVIESNDGRIAASQEAIEKHAAGAVRFDRRQDVISGKTWFTVHAEEPLELIKLRA